LHIYNVYLYDVKTRNKITDICTTKVQKNRI